VPTAVKLQAVRLKLRVYLGVCASGDDVMADALADFLASNLAGIARLRAYLLHLRGPWPVMVATARRRSVALLPDMRRFRVRALKVFLRRCAR